MIQRVLPTLRNMLFPPRCLGCGRLDVLLCHSCREAMAPATGPDRCPFCAAQWDGNGNCPRCFHMHEMDGIRAAFEMSGTARKMVHALKYRFYRDAAPEMANLMCDLSAEIAADRWFAVPLHRSREKERGFNQSALLLARTGWTPVSSELKRVRRTDRQVGQRLGERRANVSGAFVYSGPRLDGLTVALVDDVVTTGATMLECSRTLRDAGARSVWGFAFARASYKPETPEPIDD